MLLHKCCLNIEFLQFPLFFFFFVFFNDTNVILQAGDIETNPGPENICELSIVHLNIRSIRNKIEYITDNLLDFNSLCFTETHLDASSF